MKKIITRSLGLFVMFGHSHSVWQAEIWTKNLINKYSFSSQNLEKPLTRAEFVKTLYRRYPDYKLSKWVKLDLSKISKIDNSKYFQDVNLNSDFGRKLSFFVNLWAFTKLEKFKKQDYVTQKTFFLVMKRLAILFGLQNCVYHKICEKEIDEKTKFTKWTYYKYVSKILNPKLRKYYKTPWEYIKAWYKPFLPPNYNFPIRGQTLNGCYAFSVRNILKFKYWIWIHVSKAENFIKKPSSASWSDWRKNKFDQLVGVERKSYYHLDTLINALAAGEPMALTYFLKYYSYKDKKYKTVWHIVAAYSFDKSGVRVAETVSSKKTLVPWNELFNSYWKVSVNRMFKYYYTPETYWTLWKNLTKTRSTILMWEY